jgi:uncharacterized membrane protein YfcA
MHLERGKSDLLAARHDGSTGGDLGRPAGLANHPAGCGQFAALVVCGVLVVLRDLLTGGVAIPTDWQPLFLLSVGILEGLVAGVVGISGGPILAPLFVWGLGMPQHRRRGVLCWRGCRRC